MSYPSIKDVLAARNIVLEDADDETLANAIYEALRRDLSNGVDYLTGMVKNLAGIKEKRILRVLDPNSPLGKQIIRLVGSDIARNILEQKLCVSFALYNCCAPVAAYRREDLAISYREQIELQNGFLASADC